jgi:uncharacterized protein YeaO (DUF488 family)
MALRIKRIYDEPASEDGYRILVDKLWPRGVSKEKAALDLWLKDIAPSPELRTWFGHKAERFAEFSRRYEAELEDNPAVQDLQAVVKGRATVTLLYAAHDSTINHAVVLKRYISRLGPGADSISE